MIKLPCGNCEELHPVPCIKCKGELDLLDKIDSVYYVRCKNCGYEGSFSDNEYSKPDPNYFVKRNSSEVNK